MNLHTWRKAPELGVRTWQCTRCNSTFTGDQAPLPERYVLLPDAEWEGGELSHPFRSYQCDEALCKQVMES